MLIVLISLCCHLLFRRRTAVSAHQILLLTIIYTVNNFSGTKEHLTTIYFSLNRFFHLLHFQTSGLKKVAAL